MIPLTAGDPATSLNTLQTVFTAVVAWFVEAIGTISHEPLLLLGVAFMCVAVCIRLAFKAVHGRG